MNEKKCVKCATLSEEHFTYCRYCGAMLPVVDKDPLFTENFSDTAKAETHAEITPKDYECYIGPNADKITEVFDNMSVTGAKGSWCVPVFILGLLFGFYGISAWFFSRKLNKYAFFSLLAGVVLSFADAVINRQLSTELYGLFTNWIGKGIPDIYSFSSFLSGMSEYFYLKISLFSFFGTVFTFVSSFFALNCYKKKADGDILQIKTTYVEESDIPLAVKLRHAGGLKSFRAILPLAVGALTNIIFFAGTVLL